MTNADRIRKMTDEELAEWFSSYEHDILLYDDYEDRMSRDDWLYWLQLEEEEDRG